jgi:tRNA(Ile)-lysidine synthase
VPPRHPTIARALGLVRAALEPLLAQRSQKGARLHEGRALVACSGGPDSAALLGLLELLAPGLDLQLVIGHVDHGLRPESAQEASMVADMAEQRGHGVAITRLDLQPGPGLPARARQARRSALVAQASEAGVGFIALGHTATDQAETMLMHLARGAGLEGIAAMAAIDRTEAEQPGPLWLRPLLELSRAETREIASRMHLPFVDDPTNLDPSHPRVRLREELLPILRQHYPRVEHAFAAAARQVADARDAVASWVERELRQRTHDDAAAALSTDGVCDLPRAVRTSLLRRYCIARGCDSESLRHEVIESVNAALFAPHRPEGRSWDLHPGLRLYLREGALWVDGRADCVAPDDEDRA